MSNDIVQIRRKTFDAEARRVTPLNINDVARWCDGIVHNDGDKDLNMTREYIKVPVIKPQNLSQTEAHVGDWVVRQGRGFKVYKDGALKGMFELKNGQPIDGEARQNRPKPNKQKKYQKGGSVGPNPGQMPKRLVPAEPGRGIDQPVKEIVNPEAAQAVRTEDLGGLDIPPATPEERQTLPEEGIEKINEDIPVTNGEAPQRPQLGDPELRELGLPTSIDPGYKPVYEDELDDLTAPEKQEYGPATVDSTVAAVPGAITLDELNALPGDTRTQTDILRERAEGAVGSEPVLDGED